MMYYESKDKKYYTSIGYAVFNDTISKFKNEDSWFVDVKTNKHYIVDEDFYSNYDDAVITFKEWVQEIKKYDKQLIKKGEKRC